MKLNYVFRLLWLQFQQGGEEEFDLGKNPKPVVFVIHTFLSAKIQQLSATGSSRNSFIMLLFEKYKDDNIETFLESFNICLFCLNVNEFTWWTWKTNYDNKEG